MLRQIKVAVSFVLLAFSLMMEGTPDANELQTTRCHQGRCRRKAFSVGLWSLPCKRRVGMDAGRKRRTQYRILVYLLAYKAWKRMVALGYGCS